MNLRAVFLSFLLFFIFLTFVTNAYPICYSIHVHHLVTQKRHSKLQQTALNIFGIELRYCSYVSRLLIGRFTWCLSDDAQPLLSQKNNNKKEKYFRMSSAFVVTCVSYDNLYTTLWLIQQTTNWHFIILSPRNRAWYFMQIVSFGDDLHKMSKPVFWGK